MPLRGTYPATPEDVSFLDPGILAPYAQLLGHAFPLWLHALADTVIVGACAAIPFVLYCVVRKRADIPFPKVLLLFAVWVALDGALHLAPTGVRWHPADGWEIAVKALAALISLMTLWTLIRLLPKTWHIAKFDHLAALNEKLLATNRELQTLYRQSEASGEARLRAVVDNVVDGIITINAQGMVESFNPACARIFGYPPQEVIGQNIKMLMPEPYHSEHDGYLHNYHATGIAKVIGIGREVSGRRKDGSVFPMDLSVSAFNVDGQRYFSGIVRDISERKEAESIHEQLRHAQKMDSLGQLTGGVAHDFNNLLAIILGNLDFINERLPPDDPLRRFVAPSITAAEHGADLTKQLLAFGRKQALQPKIVDLNELLRYFTILVRHTLGERIEIINPPTPDLWLVNVDPGQLQNALLNLAVNARDAMPDGGKLVFETSNILLDTDYTRLHTDVAVGEYVQLAVSDTGEGMSPDIIEKAFDPFFTTKDIGKGSGLGLSMVYGFIKQSRGHIKIYSEPGHGTSIKIYLPRVEGTPDARLPLDTQVTNSEKKDVLILVVEDNADVLTLTASMAESLGYCVLHAINGDAAMEILRARSDITLLLTDVMLPGTLNGPALAQKAVALRPGLKVLFNSGYAEHAIMQSGLLEEGVHLIGKPFRKAELAAKIEEVLREGLLKS